MFWDRKPCYLFRKRGRKLAKPVLPYSLSWARDETPDKREMSRAVDGSLETLGLEGHEVRNVRRRRAACRGDARCSPLQEPGNAIL